MFPRDDGLKAVWSEWHEKRQRARETAFSPDEFGEIERIKFDLDDAGITGRANPRSYKGDRPIDLLGENAKDVRENPKR